MSAANAESRIHSIPRGAPTRAIGHTTRPSETCRHSVIREYPLSTQIRLRKPLFRLYYDESSALRADPPCRGSVLDKNSMRNLLTLYLAISLALAAADKKPPAAPKGGIKTPGVQIPVALLKSEAQLDAAPEWIGVADLLLIPNAAKGTLDHLDPKTNAITESVPGISKPCGGAVSAFASVWAPSCDDHSLVRVDSKKWEVTARIATGVGTATLALAA